MSQKVLQISADEAKYIDPNQIASIQLTDGTTVIVNDSVQEDFVEEAQNEDQYQTQEAQTQNGQKLRGRGVVGALAGAALLGTAAALGGAAMRRPYYGYGYGMRPLMPPPPRMMYPPMMRPRYGMMRPIF